MRMKLLSGILFLCLCMIGTSALALQSEDGWYYVTIEGKAWITSYAYTTEELTIPETVDGYPVAGLRKEDVNSHPQYNIGVLTIPAHVKSIQASAFQGSSIVSLIVESSETVLGVGAFQNCDRLTSVTLPDDLEALPALCFSGCTSLTTIHLPNSLTSIGESCFDGCIKLNALHLPSQLKTLGSSSFANCSKLRDITLPGSLKDIGDNAFARCTSLESIIIPDSVTEIGSSAWIECSSLENVQFPSSFSNKLKPRVFQRCTSLKAISLPDGIEVLGKLAFEGCSALRTIHLPAQLSISDIPTDEEDPFKECALDMTFSADRSSDAYTWAIKRGWTYVNPSSFAWTQDIWIGNTQNGVQLSWSGDAPSAIRADNDVVTIDSKGFLTSSQPGLFCITAISMGETFTTNVLIRAAHPIILPFSLELLYEEALAGTAFTEIILPDGLLHVAANVFSACSKLTIVSLPESLKDIDDHAFDGCPDDLLLLVKPNSSQAEWAKLHEFRYMEIE